MNARNVDLSNYEVLRKKFQTIKIVYSKSKVGRRKVRLVSGPSLKEVLKMENVIRKPSEE